MGETFLSLLAQELPRSGRLAALPARGSGPPGAPGVNAGPRGPAPCQGTTGTMGGGEAELRGLGSPSRGSPGGVWSSAMG